MARRARRRGGGCNSQNSEFGIQKSEIRGQKEGSSNAPKRTGESMIPAIRERFDRPFKGSPPVLCKSVDAPILALPKEAGRAPVVRTESGKVSNDASACGSDCGSRDCVRPADRHAGLGGRQIRFGRLVGQRLEALASIDSPDRASRAGRFLGRRRKHAARILSSIATYAGGGRSPPRPHLGKPWAGSL